MSLAIPPVLVSMAKDRRLRPSDIQVFLIAAQTLDFVEYRPLKLLVLAHDLRTDRSTVSKALARLVLHRYLDRGARESETGPYTFRIPFSMAGGGGRPAGGVAKLTTPQVAPLSSPPDEGHY